MEIHFIPHAPPYRITWPDNAVSVIGCLLICLIIALIIRAEMRGEGRHTRVKWPVVAVLAFLGVVFNTFLGITFKQIDYIQTNGLSNHGGLYILMVLSAFPWMLAAGLFGGIPGLIVGFSSGAMKALFFSQTLLSPLETSLLAVSFAWLVKQSYRTSFFRAARHPLFAAIALSIGVVPVHVLGLLITGNGSLYLRLDEIFRIYPAFIYLTTAELLLAGLLCEGIFHLVPPDLLRLEYLTPSPAERNLRTRFAMNISPWVFILYLFAALVAWKTSETNVLKRYEVREAIEMNKLTTTLQAFIQSETDSINQISADPRLFYQDPSVVEKSLKEAITNRPTFNQLIVVDQDINVIASQPMLDYQQGEPNSMEAEEITRVFQDGQMRLASLPALRESRTAQISFIQPVQGENTSPVRVLIGRAQFSDNPQGELLLTAFDASQSNGTVVELIDENGYVIYHPASSEIMTRFIDEAPEYDGLYQTESKDGSRQWIFYQSISPTGWGLYMLTPGWVIQQEVLRIAGLMLLLSFGIVLLVSFAIWVSLGNISKTIVRLTMDAEKIAKGQMAVPIRQIKDTDEIGQLSQAFEKMRGAMKNRMDELNSLVEVSQGVASSLAIREALAPILEAALGDNASAARIIIENNGSEETELATGFGAGPSSEAYSDLDDPVCELTRQHGQVVINNLQRGRVLTFPPEKPHPASLIAIPLQHEEEEHGTFWVAYDAPHNFTDEEVRFIKTLAGEAVLASTNARLYDSAALGRQRLEAVLASTPDPILVIDQKARLILLNPAARELAGGDDSSLIGKQVREVFTMEELRKLLTAVGDSQISKELKYPDGRVFYATLSPVLLEDKQVGKVCLLRDVTRFKELDGLKTEFVATASHDLRSPLLTARGYASMLAMVGELNEQQKSYLQKILDSIDGMTGIVNNLLDPDRLKGGKTLMLQSVQVGSIVRNVIESLRQQATQKKIELQVDLGANESKEVEVDPALLERALYNLVENAIKYAPVAGNVGFVMQWKRTNVIFKVSDNGNGIAPLDLPHIFDRPPFEDGAVDSSRTSWGLSIVKTIAERHGGRVWVESQLGQGSMFFLELPLPKQNLAPQV